ncbi:tetratricopeptide repeat protein [Mucilaginibacter sp. AW1-3]
MLKIYCFTVFLLCFALFSNAKPLPLKTDSLINVLKLTNTVTRERRLVNYVRNFWQDRPLSELSTAKKQLDSLLIAYSIENKALYDYFTETIYQSRLPHIGATENAILKGIELANENDDHYFLYMFFTQLGFLQTYKGHTIDAVSSFRAAKKEAITLKDPYSQVLVDINISDIYYRNNLYNQSLYYLTQASSLFDRAHLPEQRLKNAINNNLADNYFRLGNIDSVKKYNATLHDTRIGTYRLYIYRKRTDYYLTLLQHNYDSAIKSIIALKTDPLYVFDNIDRQNLADAYYNAGKPDSAKKIIQQMLADPAQNNHPEIKLHLYQVLGQVAERKNDYKEAKYNFKMALQQSEDQINRLTQVGNITAQIKVDEMQGAYLHKEEVYQRQRLLLIFMSIIGLFVTVTVFMFYRNIRQKRYYERLLFTSHKEELAFINSHEVRKHLSNILGIVDILKHSENKCEDYEQVEDHLQNAAQSLDESIRNISEKLDKPH